MSAGTAVSGFEFPQLMRRVVSSLVPLLSYAVLVGLTGCDATGADTSPPAPPPPEVTVETVVPKTVDQVAEWPGRVRARRTAEVRARVDGIVTTRRYTEGSEVAAGAALFQLDRAEFDIEVARARAAVKSAQVTHAKAIARAARYDKLIVNSSISTEQRDNARADVYAEKAAIDVAAAELKRAELDLARTTITAPIAGRIGRALVTEGALVSGTQATHLATIEQIEPVYVDFVRPAGGPAVKATPESAAAAVQVVLDDTQPPLAGQLLFSESSVDPTTGEVTMSAEIPNPARVLLPGMYVRVRLIEDSVTAAITVSQRALQRNQAGAYVLLVAADGTVENRPVVTGRALGQRWLIRSGLIEGDKVIVEGLQKVQPGQTVNAVEAAAATPAASGVAG